MIDMGRRENGRYSLCAILKHLCPLLYDKWSGTGREAGAAEVWRHQAGGQGGCQSRTGQGRRRQEGRWQGGTRQGGVRARGARQGSRGPASDGQASVGPAGDGKGRLGAAGNGKGGNSQGAGRKIGSGQGASDQVGICASAQGRSPGQTGGRCGQGAQARGADRHTVPGQKSAGTPALIVPS